MRKGQLIKKVLKAYKYHIKYILENTNSAEMDEVWSYIGKHNITHGICLYISSTLDYSHYHSGYRAKWVGKYSDDDGRWGIYPSHAVNFTELLTSLQLRVDIMERELLSGDKLHQRLDSKQYSFA